MNKKATGTIKKLMFVFFIFIIILITCLCIFIYGQKKYFGLERDKIEFNKLSSVQQTKINKSIKGLVNIEPNIETITYTVYKNDVSNYNIKFNNYDESTSLGDNLPKLDESYSSTNATGYYYKDNMLYLVIGERDYSKWLGEDNSVYNNEVLRELDNLIKILDECFNYT